MKHSKQRIASLEKTLDSFPTKDGMDAIKDARADLKKGRTISLGQAKKILELRRQAPPADIRAFCFFLAQEQKMGNAKYRE